MSGLISSVGTLIKLASNRAKDGAAADALNTLQDDKVKLLRADGSMMKLLGNYIVEPVAVVSDDLKDVAELDSVLGLHMDLFTGYYMQVFDILINQYGVDITTAVDTLGTDNGGLDRAITKGLAISLENSVDPLTSLIMSAEADNNELGSLVKKKNNKRLADEIVDDLERQREKAKVSKMTKAERAAYITARTNKDIIRTPVKLSDAAKDLLIPNAIQRTIQITAEAPMTEPGTDKKYHTRTIIIPVTIKLAVIFTSKDNIINAISTSSDDYSFSSRLDEYRAGAISLADFLLATDLIDKYRHKKLKDKDSLLSMLKSRELSSNSKIITNGFAGFEKYYNMYIVSPETKVAIEREVRNKLRTPKGKDKFLEAGNGLSVTVMDPDYERISIGVKDIRGTTDLSFRAAVKKDKGGSDYSEIIKALMANKPPVF